MDKTVITIICTVAGIIITFVFSYLAYHRTNKKDSKDEGESYGIMMSDIGYIKAGVDDLKREQREQATAIGLLSERVTRCEESCKQAHHRIDEIKGDVQQ